MAYKKRKPITRKGWKLPKSTYKKYGAKRVFKRKTKKRGTVVTTNYVPVKAKRKMVKSWGYNVSKKYGGGKRFAVRTIFTKTFKTAKGAAKFRALQTRGGYSKYN